MYEWGSGRRHVTVGGTFLQNNMYACKGDATPTYGLDDDHLSVLVWDVVQLEPAHPRADDHLCACVVGSVGTAGSVCLSSVDMTCQQHASQNPTR